MDQIKIGKFISECRNKENLSLEQLAKKLDIDVHTIIKWESGKSLPDSSMIINLCKVLNITPTDLLNGELIEKNEFNNQEKLIYKYYHFCIILCFNNNNYKLCCKR